MLKKIILLSSVLAASTTFAGETSKAKVAPKVEPKIEAKVEPKIEPKIDTNLEVKEVGPSIYPMGVTVSTSPYMGIRTLFDASDVVVNLSTMNEDLRILQQRKKLSETLKTKELPWHLRPFLELSGDVVGDVILGQSYHRRGSDFNSSTDIDLLDVRLDALASVSQWAYGLISLGFDNSNLDEELAGNGRRINNSRIFIQRAFLTIGDLNVSPAYFSIGQMYVPFGRYSSGIISTTPTSKLGKTNTRAALIGAYYEGLFAQGYGFRGDSFVHNRGINQWGLNVGYEHQYEDFSYEVGTGYIANIADSSGLQNTFMNPGFAGFAFSRETERLEHRVPGFDVYGRLGYKCFFFNVEYVTATREFARNDLAFNFEGAQPAAFYVDGTVRGQVFERPFGFTVAYGFSTEALGVNIPKQSYIAALSGSIWKNTIEGIEYRHDVDYSNRDSASGSHSDTVFASGGSRNSVVADVGIYF